MEISSLLPPHLSAPSLAAYIILTLTFLYIFIFHYLSTSKPNPPAAPRTLDWAVDLLRSHPTHTITLSSSVITANPANIEHFLVTRFDNYPKGAAFSATLRDLLGGGIFNADGDLWRLQRKTASLEFNTKFIRAFIMDTVRLEVADRLLPVLSRAAKEAATIDLQEVLELFAFDNVCRVAFGVDPGRLASDGMGSIAGGEGNRGSQDSNTEAFGTRSSDTMPNTMDGGLFAGAFDEATMICITRFQQYQLLWRLRRAFRLGDERRLREALGIVNEFAMRVLRERKAKRRMLKGENSAAAAATTTTTTTTGDLLSRFVAEGDFSDEFLRDIVISFVLAGRDTTSSALTWFFYMVSTHPEVRERIIDEIESVRSSRNKKDGEEEEMYTLEELRKMEYLHAALSETLRLYPPVPLQPRTCASDDMLPDGTRVRKGWSVSYNSYAMGRMESVWGEDCREFKPERWLERGVFFQPKSPYKFPIFHAGPRMCLGKEMAYIQMKAVAASVLERFEIEVAEEGERVHDFTIILKMRNGLPVRLRERRQ